MNPPDLLTAPRWRPEDLGAPLPDSPHAITVAMPRWDDVVGYEEKRPETMARLRRGYPRFLVHPLVQAVAAALAPGRPCLPFPSPRVAEQAAAFVRAQSGAPVELVRRGAVTGVVTDAAGEPALKAFWQHTGLILSTRQAEAFLNGTPEPADAPERRAALRRQLAALYDCAPEDVFLQPTGMAAQFAALRVAQQRRPGRPTAQLGFPYVDTFKLQQKFGPGAYLLHRLDRIVEELEALLARQPLAAGFCEIPGNPLLGSADLRRVSPRLRAQGVLLIADDVAATPLNVDLGAYADLIATSLSKYLVGTADAMGGAVICPPRSPWHAELRARLAAGHEELLWGGDAAVLEAQVRGFPERMARHNRHGLLIAERLRAHPAVARVWYPRWEFSESYEAVRRPGGGWGALITFEPRRAASAAPRIYDRLEVNKGPSFGTVFTLACPFTLLAHYTELDWAEACGVSRYLLRLSVGLEDPEELWSRLARALAAGGAAAEAHPA
jgi:cystathionine gamma-synthase